MSCLHFLIPGDIETATGGYAYDREIAAALAERGWQIRIEPLAEDLGQAKADADERLSALRENSLVLIDGLALADLAGVVARHKDRLRLVALVHHPAALETGLPAARAAVVAREESRALLSVSAIVCTSKWTAQTLVGSGIPRARVHVVEPGVVTADGLGRATNARRNPEHAFAAGLRLLCVATITPRKGHDVLIQALAALSDLPWSLKCIGSRHRAPEHAREIEALIHRNALQNRVELLGEVDRATLLRAYAEADLFVLASRLEGYGMVLAEARAAGLPIVATAGGAVTDTLSGAAAVIVDPDSPAQLAAALRTTMLEASAWRQLTDAAAADASATRQWAEAAAQLAATLEAATR